MDLMITITVIVVSIFIIIRAIIKNGNYDLEIQAWKFRLSIKKHD